MKEIDFLKNDFQKVLKNFSVPKETAAESWKEIEVRYSEPHRKYHTLTHLFYFLNRLKEFENRIQDRDTTVLALFYHDLIYDVKQNDNEEKSAEIAGHRLNTFGFSEERIETCKRLILATKGHEKTDEYVTNIFVDCDLSILGAESNYYQEYASQIRQEYIVYPDELYKPGRKKVLEHFLSMDFIFKTEEYRNKKENEARKNLSWELGTFG